MAARLQRWRAELLAPYDVADLVGRTVTPAGCQLVTTIPSPCHRDQDPAAP